MTAGVSGKHPSDTWVRSTIWFFLPDQINVSGGFYTNFCV
jgi:hypothetical protein